VVLTLTFTLLYAPEYILGDLLAESPWDNAWVTRMVSLKAASTVSES